MPIQKYTLPDVSFSVSFHNGQWCMFNKKDAKQAETPEQIEAIKMWKQANQAKHER